MSDIRSVISAFRRGFITPGSLDWEHNLITVLDAIAGEIEGKQDKAEKEPLFCCARFERLWHEGYLKRLEAGADTVFALSQRGKEPEVLIQFCPWCAMKLPAGS